MNVLKKHKEAVMLAFLAIISGLGNTLIITIINKAVYGTDSAEGINLLLFFLLGLAIYLISQKLLRTKFIRMTNTIIYKKRREITDKILNTSYDNFEKIQSGRIYAGLNNDTEIISECANIIILSVTAVTTLLCCFVYLAFVYIWGLLISLAVIILAGYLYYQAGKKSRLLWNQSRDIQNNFFQYITELILGFKELAIHKDKKKEFKEDMFEQGRIYKETRSEALIRFANVFILGEFLFNTVTGSVIFIFPLLFLGLSHQVIVSFVIIFLYMSSPIYTLLSLIPNLLQVKISWDRVNDLLKELEILAETEKRDSTLEEGNLKLEIQNLEFQYADKQERQFMVGPLNYCFQSGEIIFITGGNGSGKSTLGKLLTGLYPKAAGKITMNEKEIESEELGKYFSAIFSDSFLFEKLYGIDCSNKEREIEKYLNLLKMNQKVEIKNGRFTHTKLSTGQRKRLALLVSFLENRKIYLFDEWAADQDPEFRHFFYEDLIHQLKENGKCVIAITHDEHYFHHADKVIKMNLGKIED